ncbi:MAG: FAD-dependent oxidoreductase [Clostridia bacterium]|nr:FAD-dependent oxidoreductase [Clostridia bacterium]
MIYDVAIIGGGVIGCAILNKLTRIGKKCVLLEKGSDVSVGTTKANSGIVHAGFDAKPNTLKAILNVKGAKLFPGLCKELDVPFKQNGALVIGNDMSVVNSLYERGLQNGVQGLKVLDRQAVLEKVPSITDNITCGLYAETSAIVSPYEFAIALAEESVINGAQVVLNFTLSDFKKASEGYSLSDGTNQIIAKKIVVAVGGAHNEVAEILNATKYDLKYRRGEYYLLDKGAMDIGGYTIFPLPTKDSKGVLISATTSGNIIVGPTSIPSETDSTITTKYGLDDIASKANSMLSNVNLRKNIRVFSGVRTLVGDDFVIEKDSKNSDIINVTGICSPGLSASPAIAEYVLDLLGFENKEVVIKKLEPKIRTQYLSSNEINKLIAKEPRYGKIVCRCEGITEMEIINAINSPLKPTSVDAIKRRTRAGMGRCQGGFCFLKVMELLAKEHNIKIDDITKENQNSRIIVGDIR